MIGRRKDKTITSDDGRLSFQHDDAGNRLMRAETSNGTSHYRCDGPKLFHERQGENSRTCLFEMADSGHWHDSTVSVHPHHIETSGRNCHAQIFE